MLNRQGHIRALSVLNMQFNQEGVLLGEALIDLVMSPRLLGALGGAPAGSVFRLATFLHPRFSSFLTTLLHVELLPDAVSV